MGYQTFWVVLALVCVQTAVHCFSSIKSKNDKCEMLLTSSICRQMDYNRTIFPNYFGHRKQSEAVKHISSLQPLLAVGCSPDVLTFACSVYFPMCTSINKLIPPCRELCLDVQKGCLGLLRRFGMSWPDDLKCDQFPKVRTEICVFQNKTGVRPTVPTSFSVMTTRRKKVVQPSSRKVIQKYCPASRVKNNQWNSDTQKDCCKCCQRGNRAARGGLSKCTLRKSFSKEKSFLKTLKECPSRKTKRCYQDCCNAKRKEIQNKSKSKTRRNRNRRNRNKNKRKRPRTG